MKDTHTQPTYNDERYYCAPGDSTSHHPSGRYHGSHHQQKRYNPRHHSGRVQYVPADQSVPSSAELMYREAEFAESYGDEGEMRIDIIIYLVMHRVPSKIPPLLSALKLKDPTPPPLF